MQNFLKEYSPKPAIISFVGPNLALVEKSDKADAAYLDWFASEIGTVPQMVHNMFSRGWSQHHLLMTNLFDKQAADMANKSFWSIAHWGILYTPDKSKKIPVPLTDDPATIYFRPAYGDQITITDPLTNGLLQMYISSQCTWDTYYHSEAQKTRPPTEFEHQLALIAQMLKEVAFVVLEAGHKPLSDFFRVID